MLRVGNVRFSLSSFMIILFPWRVQKVLKITRLMVKINLLILLHLREGWRVRQEHNHLDQKSNQLIFNNVAQLIIEYLR